jgi:hypothetical protein
MLVHTSNRKFLRGMVFLAAVCGFRALPARAQSTSAADSNETAYCLGFSFGAWTPALDLKAAGHDAAVDTVHHLRAPGGRDWALSGPKIVGDSEIFLLPIEHAPRTMVDTVHGKALALVADGRKTPPASSIRAWEKRCGA